MEGNKIFVIKMNLANIECCPVNITFCFTEEKAKLAVADITKRYHIAMKIWHKLMKAKEDFLEDFPYQRGDDVKAYNKNLSNYILTQFIQRESEKNIEIMTKFFGYNPNIEFTLDSIQFDYCEPGNEFDYEELQLTE